MRAQGERDVEVTVENSTLSASGLAALAVRIIFGLTALAALGWLVFGLDAPSSTSTSEGSAAATESSGDEIDVVVAGETLVAAGSESTATAAAAAAAETDATDNTSSDEAGTDLIGSTIARPTSALQTGSISGDAESVLPTSDPDVIRIPDLVDGRIQPSILTANGVVSGWDIKDVRFRYDTATDTLLVGVNSFGILGDPDGNGDPALWDDSLPESGIDRAEMGQGEALVLIFDLDQDGEGDLLAGVHAQIEWSEFRLAEAGLGHTIAPNLGAVWGPDLGELAALSPSPSATSPDAVFAIGGFSELVPGDAALDFGVNLFAGGIDDIVGEDTLLGLASTVPVVLEAELGDRVWADDNRNGVQDAAESGIGGITVELLDGTGAVVDTVVTDADGEYLFGVAPGTWRIRVTAPDGQSFTVADTGSDDEVDSDIDPATGISAEVSLRSGDSDLDLDAGLVAFVPDPRIDVEKSTNGRDADASPGEDLVVGSTVTFRYVVTNTGNVDLDDLVLDDSVLGAISCPVDRLAPSQSTTCLATAVVEEGPYVNVATATAQPLGLSGQPIGSPVSDDDPSHHRGVVPFVSQPSIAMEKSTNGQDADEAPGPEILEGKPVTWTYVITNTGNVDLASARVIDDQIGFVCLIGSLPVGDVAECAVDSQAVVGPYRNVADVVAAVLDDNGDRTDQEVTDQDPSHYTGVPAGPICDTTIEGTRLWRGGTVRHDTGLEAAAGSTIRVVTTEPGGSPQQPNEQLYVIVGETRYGPTPVGLGELEFTVEDAGRVVMEHWSIHHPEDRPANSLEFTWCGTDVSVPNVHSCPDTVTGPRLYRGSTTVWDTGLVAGSGSSITVVTSEPGGSPDQPNEQVYVLVGDEVVGLTPAGLGTITIDVDSGGPLRIEHWSERNPDSLLPNSVEVELCGTALSTSAAAAAGIAAGIN